MTIDNIYENISNMGNILCPYIVATGEENYYLLSPNFAFIKKDKIDYDTILDGIYVPDSDLKASFEELELLKIQSNYNYDNDDNDDNQIVIVFKLFAMIEEILFILHVANAIHIVIHNYVIVYVHLFKYKY